MKKVFLGLLSLLLVFVLSTSVISASYSLAPTGDKVVFRDDNWAYEKNNGYGYEIDEYIGSASEAELPWSFAKEYVTVVGEYSFNNNSTVTSVTTTSVIEKIGAYAFNFCSSLERIILFDSLVSLGTGCFYGNSSLKDINLEATSVTAIPAYSFAECGFSEISLPETCTLIDDMAFYNCNDLSKIIIPVGVSDISDTAFIGCNDLTVYCYKDSAAHQYAVSKNIPFVLLDAVVPTLPPTEPPTIPVTEPPTESGRYMLGDADMDGVVTIMDATVIQRVLVRYTVSVFDEKAASVTGEELNIVDATLIQRHLADIPIPYAVGEWFTCDE